VGQGFRRGAEGVGAVTQADAIVQVAPWLLAAVGGGSGVWALLRAAHRSAKALELVEAHDKLLRGNGEDNWSFPETRRRLRALGKRSDEYHETLHGQHGLYTRIGIHDEKILQWATWRHDVIDKELNRLALEIGGHDGDIEDIRKELAVCERRK